MRIAQPKHRPATQPMTFTFTRDDITKLARTIIEDKLAGGRETMLAIMTLELLRDTQPPAQGGWLVAHTSGEDAGYSLSSTESDARQVFNGISREPDVDDVFLCRVIARREAAK